MGRSDLKGPDIMSWSRGHKLGSFIGTLHRWPNCPRGPLRFIHKPNHNLPNYRVHDPAQPCADWGQGQRDAWPHPFSKREFEEVVDFLLRLLVAVSI
jgi:hypothetical protein